MSTSERRRPRTFFPTHINAYRDCPERYYLTYIRYLKRPPPFSRPLVAGGAAHRLIATVLPDFMQTGEIPTGLERDALHEVSTTEYPASERCYREQDACDVAEWTWTALDMIPAGSRSLLQERRLYAPLGRSRIEIGAQIDLVLQHPDGEIEHIDFKTGKVRDNTVQSLIQRAVIGKRFNDVKTIRTTTLFLRQRQRQTSILDRESSRPDWLGIAQTIHDIRSLDDFPPRPGPLCEYCPFQARDCSAW